MFNNSELLNYLMCNFLELKKDTSLLWSPVKFQEWQEVGGQGICVLVSAEEKASACSYCCH